MSHPQEVDDVGAAGRPSTTARMDSRATNSNQNPISKGDPN